MKPSDPDVDGRRFCRHCDKRLPVSAFPAGTRRYVCKAHLYELVKLPAKLRADADDNRSALGKLWARCRSICMQSRQAVGPLRVYIHSDID